MRRGRGSSRVRGGGHVNIYLRFAVALVFLGWVFSRRYTVYAFNMLGPVATLAIWYVVYGLFLYFVFRGAPFMGGRFGVKEAASFSILTFAFLIVFNQVESPYAAIAVGRNPDEVPPLLYATEDGVMFTLYGHLVKNLPYPLLCLPYTGYCAWSMWWDLARDLTYIATPAIIVASVALVFGASRAGRQIHRVVTAG